MRQHMLSPGAVLSDMV